MYIRQLFILLVWLAASGIATACSDGAPELPSDASPQTIHHLLTSSDGDQFLKQISLHSWGDNSEPVTALFSWIPDDATSADASRRAMAGQTAHALARFLSNNSNELRGDAGGGTASESIGVINPDLTETYAASLIPYLRAMVGDPRGTSHFESLDSGDGAMPRTVAVFAALRTGTQAADLLSTALDEVVGDYESTFAESATTAPPSVQPRMASLTHAARLLGAAESSGFESVGEHVLDVGDVVAQLQYRLVSVVIDEPNDDISPRFFDGGTLMSPNEVRSQLGESSWDEYTNQLSVFLAKRPNLADAVTSFRTTFMESSQ